MKSVRLKTICDFLSTEDAIIDIGCDHAYVPIAMAEKGAKKVLATDIHPNALQIAKKNIEEAGFQDTIETALSDGLKSVNTQTFNTLVIAGMGFSTIKHILEEKDKLKPIQKIILQSNNDLPLLRVFMQTTNFYLADEKIIWEKDHFYSVMKYVRGSKNLSEIEIEFGLYSKEHQDYYQYTLEYYQQLIPKIPEEKQKEILEKIALLKKYLA